MGHYIGIDVATEVSVAEVIDEAGNLVQVAKFPTDERSVKAFLSGVPEPKRVVFEECTQADWLYHVASEVTNGAMVCKPLKKGALSGERKGDEEDAHQLAHKLRSGDLVSVWHDGGESRKRLMQRFLTYRAVTKETTRSKNRIRAVFRGEGLRGAKKAYDKSTRATAIAKLPLQEQRERVLVYGSMLGNAERLRAMMKKRLLKEARRHIVFRRVRKTPGLGDISSATFTAIVWNPKRFRNKRKFWSYSGFSIRTRDTGQFYIEDGRIKRKQQSKVLGLTRDHNRILKCMYKRAAITLMRKAWKNEFQQLRDKGVTRENALLTFARKVAAISLHLAKHGGDYQVEKAFKAVK